VHVARRLAEPRVLAQFAIKERRVRRAERDDGIEQLGVVQGERPGDRPTPVVTDQDEALVPEGLDKRADILDRGPDAVVPVSVRLGGQVVSPLVKRYREVVARELGELVAP